MQVLHAATGSDFSTCLHVVETPAGGAYIAYGTAFGKIALQQLSRGKQLAEGGSGERPVEELETGRAEQHELQNYLGFPAVHVWIDSTAPAAPRTGSNEDPEAVAPGLRVCAVFQYVGSHHLIRAWELYPGRVAGTSSTGEKLQQVPPPVPKLSVRPSVEAWVVSSSSTFHVRESRPLPNEMLYNLWSQLPENTTIRGAEEEAFFCATNGHLLLYGKQQTRVIRLRELCTFLLPPTSSAGGEGEGRDTNSTVEVVSQLGYTIPDFYPLIRNANENFSAWPLQFHDGAVLFVEKRGEDDERTEIAVGPPDVRIHVLPLHENESCPAGPGEVHHEYRVRKRVTAMALVGSGSADHDQPQRVVVVSDYREVQVFDQAASRSAEQPAIAPPVIRLPDDFVAMDTQGSMRGQHNGQEMVYLLTRGCRVFELDINSAATGYTDSSNNTMSEFSFVLHQDSIADTSGTHLKRLTFDLPSQLFCTKELAVIKTDQGLIALQKITH
ncbi:unnamed protein product [Amoebophrya sp. A120]|nr:unnamed protein product [Amoebophrya sp. A120]|eukprot:GSA120T00025373001.1